VAVYVRRQSTSRASRSGEEAARWHGRLCPSNPDIVAQLHHALAEEMTVSLQDFLLRRTIIGQSACLGLDCTRLSAAGWRAGRLVVRRLDAELEAIHARSGGACASERVIRASPCAWRGDAQMYEPATNRNSPPVASPASAYF